jgi:hypothetical protein
MHPIDGIIFCIYPARLFSVSILHACLPRTFLFVRHVTAVGLPGDWNVGLRPYLHLLDGVTHHTYDPWRAEVEALPWEHQLRYVAAYSRAGMREDLKRQRADLGVELPMWVTEFGVGLDQAQPNRSKGCLLPELIFGEFDKSIYLLILRFVLAKHVY